MLLLTKSETMANDTTKPENFIPMPLEYDNVIEMETKTILSLMNELTTCSNHEKQLRLLTKCVSEIASLGQHTVRRLLGCELFRKSLKHIVNMAIIPCFDGREYFCYETADFMKYPEITCKVFDLVVYVLDGIACKANAQNVSLFDQISAQIDDGVQGEPITNRDVTFLLPKLCLLISGHMNKPVWSSTELENMSVTIFKKLMFLYSCDSIDTLLCECLNEDQSPEAMVTQHSTLLETCLSYCQKPLSKKLWIQNPFLCHSILWIVSQVKLPHLSDHIEQVMAMALNLLGDHQVDSKVRAIICLHHLIINTSAEEMRWLNRAEVIYDSLKNQMYTKEPQVLEHLLPCLINILKVLKSPPCLEKHHHILEVLMRDTEGENMLMLRRIYIKHFPALLEQLDFHTVRHLKGLIKIVGNYLEVDDGLGEVSARPDTLKLLSVIIKVAHPRIHIYADLILSKVLNFIADINCTQRVEDSDMSNMVFALTSEAVQCLVQLSDYCPDILPCVRAAFQAGMDYTGADSCFYESFKEQLRTLTF